MASKDGEWRDKNITKSDYDVAEKKQKEKLQEELWYLLRKMGVSRNRFDSSNSSSSTAEIACFMRHLAYLNRNTVGGYSDGDQLAVHFIHEEHKFVAQNAESAEIICEVYDKQFNGLFGHVAARTQVYDGLVAKHAPLVEQVVILGAGFDSRAYRMPCLSDKVGRVKIFEVDAPGTQAMKVLKLKEANISNKNVTYVPVNFESENFAEKLVKYGFNKTKRTLWTWEFVSPYLTPEAVSFTFNDIWKISKPSSLLAFDYCYKDFETYYGGAGLHRAVVQSGEAIFWTVAPGKMKNFLARHNLSLEEEFGPNDLESLYLTNKKTKKNYKSFGFYAIVLSKCVEEGEVIAYQDSEEEGIAAAPAQYSDNSGDIKLTPAGTQIRNEIIDILFELTEMRVQDSDTAKNLIESAGLDSLQAVSFAKDLKSRYGTEVTETYILNPTTSVDALALMISSEICSETKLDVDVSQIREEVIDLLYHHTDVKVLEIELSKNLIESAGLDSLQAVAFAKDIKTKYGVEVTETFILNPTTSVESITHLIAKDTDGLKSHTHQNFSITGPQIASIREEIIDLLYEHAETKVDPKDMNKNLIESAGLDSLQAVAVAKDIHKKYGVEITETALLNPTTSVESLTKLISNAMSFVVTKTSKTSATAIDDGAIVSAEKMIYKALKKLVGASEAGEAILLNSHDVSISKVLKGNKKDIQKFLTHVKSNLGSDIPESLLVKDSTIYDLIVHCANSSNSTSNSTSHKTGHTMSASKGLYFQPILWRQTPGFSNGNVIGELPCQTIGNTFRMVNTIPSSLAAVKATVAKSLTSSPTSDSIRNGLLDADESTAKHLGWSTREPMSWFLMEADTRIVFYPEVGVEIDLPYQADTAQLLKSLKRALAFFPILSCRMTYIDGRIIAIRGEAGRKSGVKLTTRKYSKGASPILRDMFMVQNRTMITSVEKMPWFGSWQLLTLNPGLQKRSAETSLWLSCALSNLPFNSPVASVDIMTDVPMKSSSSTVSKGTRLSVGINHSIADAFTLSSFISVWSQISKAQGDVESTIGSLLPLPNFEIVKSVGNKIKDEELQLSKDMTNLSYGIDGLIYAFGNDCKVDAFRGLLRQKELDLLRKQLPEDSMKRIAESDLVAAWLWMIMVNKSAKHWKLDETQSRWYPSVCFGVNCRRMFADLKLTTGNLIRQVHSVCPLEDGISKDELDAMLPLKADSPCMANVIMTFNTERKRSTTVAIEKLKATDKLPGFNFTNHYCYKEEKEKFRKAGPCIYLNDMTSISHTVYSFDSDEEPGSLFFSTEGLGGKMGADGSFERGCLSLSVNQQLFDCDDYKHIWMVQFLCSNSGKGACMNVLLSHNY